MSAAMSDIVAAPAARWRHLAPLGFWIGAAIVAAHVLLAIVGPFVAPYGASQMGTGVPLSGASLAHPFGVDQLGRDVWSRVIHGGHIVLWLSLSGTTLGLLVGALIGAFSGYVGGLIDNLIQRFLETLISIPFLIFALLAMVAAGPELSGQPLLVVLVVALVYFPRTARIARAAAVDIATQDYVKVARLNGESTWSVLRRDLLPNAAAVLLVEFALRAGAAPVLVGSLGFLGFGLRPPTPEWGLMISENRTLLIVSPSTVLGPGLMLASLVVGLNLLTDGVARILGRSAQMGSA